MCPTTLSDAECPRRPPSAPGGLVIHRMSAPGGLENFVCYHDLKELLANA